MGLSKPTYLTEDIQTIVENTLKSMVINNVESGGIDVPLSAEQGKMLNQKMKMVDSRDGTKHVILLSVTADGYPALKIS